MTDITNLNFEDRGIQDGIYQRWDKIVVEKSDGTLASDKFSVQNALKSFGIVGMDGVRRTTLKEYVEKIQSVRTATRKGEISQEQWISSRNEISALLKGSVLRTSGDFIEALPKQRYALESYQLALETITDELLTIRSIYPLDYYDNASNPKKAKMIADDYSDAWEIRFKEIQDLAIMAGVSAENVIGDLRRTMWEKTIETILVTNPFREGSHFPSNIARYAMRKAPVFDMDDAFLKRELGENAFEFKLRLKALSRMEPSTKEEFIENLRRDKKQLERELMTKHIEQMLDQGVYIPTKSERDEFLQLRQDTYTKKYELCLEVMGDNLDKGFGDKYHWPKFSKLFVDSKAFSAAAGVSPSQWQEDIKPFCEKRSGLFLSRTLKALKDFDVKQHSHFDDSKIKEDLEKAEIWAKEAGIQMDGDVLAQIQVREKEIRAYYYHRDLVQKLAKNSMWNNPPSTLAIRTEIENIQQLAKDAEMPFSQEQLGEIWNKAFESIFYQTERATYSDQNPILKTEQWIQVVSDLALYRGITEYRGIKIDEELFKRYRQKAASKRPPERVEYVYSTEYKPSKRSDSSPSEEKIRELEQEKSDLEQEKSDLEREKRKLKREKSDLESDVFRLERRW